MKEILKKPTMHIIEDAQGHYFVTADVHSDVYYLSKDKDVKQIDCYDKATYVYLDNNNDVFIPSLYYRACGYKGENLQKYRIKTDLLERTESLSFYNGCAYYFTIPFSNNAKLWKLNLETGIHEEIRLDIPKRKKRKIRYSYINVSKDILTIIYYYFGEEEHCFDDMFIREYEHINGKYELKYERYIEKGVRSVQCRHSDNLKEKVFFFDKVTWDDKGIRPEGVYLAVYDKEKKSFKEILNIRYHKDNSLRAYAVSFERKQVVCLWRNVISVYDLESREIICNLSKLKFGGAEAKEFFDVCYVDDKLWIASDKGVWELECIDNEY